MLILLQNAIDIEIGERRNMLDIGVFAPNEVVNLNEAKDLVQMWRSALELI